MIEDAREILKDRLRLDEREIFVLESYIEACKEDGYFSAITDIKLWNHIIRVRYYNLADPLRKHTFTISVFADSLIICKGYKNYYKIYDKVKQENIKDIMISEVKTIMKGWE